MRDRAINPRLLPGRILLPTYTAVCASCRGDRPHAGLGGEEGEELGSFCLWCGQKQGVRVIPEQRTA